MIIPALLTTNKRIATERILLAREMSGWIHVDYIDHSLYKFESLSLEDLSSLDFGEMAVEVHCMTDFPLKVLESDLPIDRLIIHVESKNWEKDYISAVNKGVDTWLAIDPFTPLASLQLPPDLSGVVMMGIEPGQMGQEFISATYDRLLFISEHYPDCSVTVDGGVGKENIRQLIAHGADNLVMGSAIFHQTHPVQAFRMYEHLSDPIGGAYDYQAA
ncbi:MAG TPA: hypothetical protein VGE59_01495 [Patescibacteria group bacterium]